MKVGRGWKVGIELGNEAWILGIGRNHMKKDKHKHSQKPRKGASG
jgi:hypothetical protein